MANQPTIEGAELRDRIDQYLRESGLAGSGARVVPLTGDASDRRYFRILTPDGPSVVLALHAGPIEFATLPFANVADLLQQVPLPVPAVLGHSDALGILALQDLGDVTLQAHLGAATPAEHAALYRRAVAFIDLLQRRGAELQPAHRPAAPPNGYLLILVREWDWEPYPSCLAWLKSGYGGLVGECKISTLRLGFFRVCMQPAGGEG